MNQIRRAVLPERGHRELEATPNDWPVIAFGCHAFLALAYLSPKRVIIGIPHPTGHGGHEFSKMLEKNGQLRKKIKDRASETLSASEQRAVWLGSRNQAL
jgi:hypothetical protein